MTLGCSEDGDRATAVGLYVAGPVAVAMERLAILKFEGWEPWVLRAVMWILLRPLLLEPPIAAVLFSPPIPILHQERVDATPGL